MNKSSIERKHCKNCKHFYVCAYHKHFNIKDFVQDHLGDCMNMDGLKRQGKADEVIYKMLVTNCRYFNKNAYSNTYVRIKNERN